MERQTDPRRDILTILIALGVLGAPIALTLLTVHPAAAGERLPTPFGYTVSLSIFIFPVLVIFGRHLRATQHRANRRALVGSAAAIAVLGTALDFAFGHSFFVYPNTHATLGIRLPAWSWTDMQWIPDYLPVEEFAFYIFGGFYLIGLYLWFDEKWLPDYHPHTYAQRAKETPRLLHINPVVLGIWVLLVAAGFWAKRVLPQPYGSGFPGYFVFLMTLGLLPTFLCVRGIARFVNWRAFASSSLVMILVSIVWEVTLALPFNWWNYRREHMIGLNITAWHRLPIEATILWVVAAWASLVAFEFFRVYFHMERPLKHALLGRPAGAPPADSPSGGAADRAPTSQ